MALFTDGAISSLEDLQALDSAIVETARTEGVDLSRKLVVAEEALRLELAAFLLRAQSSPGTVTVNAYDLSRVVVTPELRRWHSLRTLQEVYGDVYNSHLNDRYAGKWQHFTSQVKETVELIFEVGIGLVDLPVPRPAKPAVTAAGTGGAIGPYVVMTAWVGQRGDRGALSEGASIDAPNGELLTVDAGAAPAGVTGFDVYVGFGGAAPVRQNAAPVSAGTQWQMPAGGAVIGPEPGSGQTASYYIRRSRLR
ncbi:MAG: hypothetical protein U0Q16_11640 [Bryobacteraceae bacterium]